MAPKALVVEDEPETGQLLAEILRRRGAIRCAAVRAPGAKLDADDMKELDRLLARLELRLAQRGEAPRRAVA